MAATVPTIARSKKFSTQVFEMQPLRSEKTSILKVLKNQLFALVIPRFRVPTVQGKWLSG